jgi:ABC-type molybdate transport system substrate-binding protein
MQGAAESAQRFIQLLLNRPAQDILARSGFAPP